MDPDERQYWDRGREAENLRREQERQRDRQFPPGALEEAEYEYARQGMQRTLAEQREREAQGCHCEYRASNEDDKYWWRNQRLTKPRRDCPLHSHLVPQWEESKKQAERKRQAEEQKRQAREREQARGRAAKSVVKDVVLWPVASLVALVITGFIWFLPMGAAVAGSWNLGGMPAAVIVSSIAVIVGFALLVWLARFLKEILDDFV